MSVKSNEPGPGSFFIVRTSDSGSVLVDIAHTALPHTIQWVN
jgi:hypothetical protein